MCMPSLPQPRPRRSSRVPGPWYWYASARYMLPGARRQPPPPPVQPCVKRGDQYTPVDTASMDLGDHRATPTPPGGNPLAIATPMVARTTYDRARGGLVVVRSALGAQQLRDSDWKGWSASWVSYAPALQPAKPVGFKVLGAQAPALRDWVLPRLTGERPAGTPSLTTVFGLIGRDLRAAQEAAGGSAKNADPPGGPAPSEPDPEPEHPSSSQTQN